MKTKIKEYINFGTIPAILFVIFIYILASFCWLCEHMYNLITKRKWEGMSL